MLNRPKGNQRAQLAIELYVNSIIRYIGQYIAELQGIDAITFTVGIDENTVEVWKLNFNYFNYLRLAVDHKRNDVRKKVA